MPDAWNASINTTNFWEDAFHALGRVAWSVQHPLHMHYVYSTLKKVIDQHPRLQKCMYVNALSHHMHMQLVFHRICMCMQGVPFRHYACMAVGILWF